MTGVPSRLRAPAVQYPVGRSAWLCTLVGLWSLAALLALVAWAALGAHGQPQGLVAGVFVLWGLVGASAWRFWMRLPAGVLAWDGQLWELRQERTAGIRGSLTVHLDLQRRLMVRLQASDGRSRWVWLEARHAPGLWSDLRRAVYSRPGTGFADMAGSAQQQSGPA